MTTKFRLRNPRVEEGDLYLAGLTEDGEQVIVFDLFIVAEGSDGDYAHFLIFKGSDVSTEGFVYPNYYQKKDAETFLRKILSKTSIIEQTFDADPSCWTKLPTHPSLEMAMQIEYEREQVERNGLC